MFYEQGYVAAQERILKAGGELSKIILDELRKLYVSTYEGTGYASPETAKAISYRWDYDKGKKVPTGDPLLDNINMMALTRSSNRCKRQIVKVRAPSSEEVSALAKGETITLEAEPEEESAKETLKNEIQQDELPLEG